MYIKIFKDILVYLIFNKTKALDGLNSLLTTGFSSPDKFAKVLYQAAPLILTGLSVAFAFKTGLFNIGASGQYVVGAFCALFSAIVLYPSTIEEDLEKSAGLAITLSDEIIAKSGFGEPETKEL